MRESRTITGNRKNRLQELQEKFQVLEPKMENSNTKQAISIIYGMFQELLRQANSSGPGQSHRETALKDIANMYRKAPKMEGPAMNTPLQTGTLAPDFSLKDQNGNSIKLSDYKGSTVLLVFYPLDWSPGCSQQLDLYQQEWNEFERRDVEVLAISVDSIYSHGAWAAVRSINIPLLSDFHPKGEVAKKYNVFRDPDGFSERALFIIDKDSVIRYSYVSPYIHHIPDIYGLFSKLDEICKPVETV